ncbi:MAG TPA: phosphate signaling complex protein PhoU [Candidatus Avanaerovorax faecigallinarum]|nr:phosphate signaling complex protein PhoU [Candidatus Avanaerovorax faecigallinarum]
MRNRFDEQLALLNVELIKMGSLCELAVSNAMKGLFDGSEEMLNIAVDTDHEIDEKEKEIENLCLKLLLQQQPVARDLRVISSALKMISDMERIGDQASDISEIAGIIKGTDAQTHTHLKKMADAATKMVADAVRSFVDKDLKLAHQVMRDDDVVDEVFNKMRQDIIAFIRGGEASAELCLDLMMIAKYLERIGDHAVNIAEWVEFSILGEHLSREERYADK